MCYPIPQQSRPAPQVEQSAPQSFPRAMDEGARVNPFDCPEPEKAFAPSEPVGPLGNGC
jgi:hypothetical protein